MKVLDLGLPRTGTQSLADALTILGFERVYHMREVNKDPTHRLKWIELMDAKYSPKQRPIGPEELQELLKAYDACADFPVALFPLEAVGAFPDTKIIVTTRDEDGWIRSMNDTLVYSREKRKGKPSEPRHEMADKYHTYCWGDDFEANGRKYWNEYHSMLRANLPKDRVLWYEVKQGWGPLCEFLGVEVPQKSFPRADDWAQWRRPKEQKT